MAPQRTPPCRSSHRQGAGVLAAAIFFTAIVKRMLGPAADEVAEMWRDQVRVYRLATFRK